MNKPLTISTILVMISCFGIAIYFDIKQNEPVIIPEKTYYHQPAKDWNTVDLPPGKKLWLNNVYMSE